MKKIGKGLQYIAYLLDGRVLKKETSLLEKIIILLSWEIHLLKNPIILFQKALQAQRITKNSISGLKNNKKIPSKLLGNPQFFQDSYTQDLLTPLGKLLHKDDSLGKEIIDKYILFLTTCWKYGFSEIVFNYTINTGLNASGEIVLIDLGECVFSKEVVLSAIEKKSWETQWSYLNDTPPNLKEYYKQRMSESITFENLEKQWGTHLS